MRRSCSGGGQSLFCTQLLALHRDVLKFDRMGHSIYLGPGTYRGWTAQNILNEGNSLLTDRGSHDFTSFRETVDDINYNGN